MTVMTLYVDLAHAVTPALQVRSQILASTVDLLQPYS